MSAYTTIAKVRSFMPEGAELDASTYPTVAQATTMITDASAAVDKAYSDGGGTPPLTATVDTDDLDVKVAREVVYQVMVLREGTSSGKTEPLWQQWHDEFQAMLTTMAATTENVKAVYPAPTLAPSSFTMEADPDADDPLNINAHFTKGKRF